MVASVASPIPSTSSSSSTEVKPPCSIAPGQDRLGGHRPHSGSVSSSAWVAVLRLTSAPVAAVGATAPAAAPAGPAPRRGAARRRRAPGPGSAPARSTPGRAPPAASSASTTRAPASSTAMPGGAPCRPRRRSPSPRRRGATRLGGDPGDAAGGPAGDGSLTPAPAPAPGRHAPPTSRSPPGRPPPAPPPRASWAGPSATRPRRVGGTTGPGRPARRAACRPGCGTGRLPAAGPGWRGRGPDAGCARSRRAATPRVVVASSPRPAGGSAGRRAAELGAQQGQPSGDGFLVLGAGSTGAHAANLGSAGAGEPERSACGQPRLGGRRRCARSAPVRAAARRRPRASRARRARRGPHRARRTRPRGPRGWPPAAAPAFSASSPARSGLARCATHTSTGARRRPPPPVPPAWPAPCRGAHPLQRRDGAVLDLQQRLDRERPAEQSGGRADPTAAAQVLQRVDVEQGLRHGRPGPPPRGLGGGSPGVDDVRGRKRGVSRADPDLPAVDRHTPVPRRRVPPAGPTRTCRSSRRTVDRDDLGRATPAACS